MNVIVVPCLHDNYAYIIYNEETAEAAVVDPSEAWPVLRVLGERELILKAVLCTHHHHDHVGGIKDLLDESPGIIRVLGFGGDTDRIPLINEPLSDGDSMTICGSKGKVVHTPGHTTGGIVYSFDDCLFTGDTLFGAGCGRLFEGTAEQMLHSLQKIRDCGAGKKIYFGHEYTLTNLRFAAGIEPHNDDIKKRTADVEKRRKGDQPSSPSTMDEELLTNPFLRCVEPSLVSYCEQNSPLQQMDPLCVFTKIREVRNSFS